jgi:DNA-binding XRE family transcriptional regulator
MDEFSRAFGRKLRDARKKAGLSQEDLADRVDLSRTSITNIEKGAQHPSLKLALKLADEVDVALSDLTDDGDDDAAPKKRTVKRTVERSLEHYPESSQEWFRSIVSEADDD